MLTKVLELDLAEELQAIPVETGFKTYYILVRYHRLPVGWITVSANSKPFISADELTLAVQRQLGTRLLHQAQSKLFSPEVPQTDQVPKGISVIVCTRNRTQLLARCLQTLLALDYPIYEIIVVDNAPSDDATLELAEKLPVRYVREERPGLDWARNRGIAAAKYPIVAFTDDDACADRFWLQAIAKTLQDPSVSAVTGLVAPAELSTKAQRVFELGYGGMGHGFRKRRLSRTTLSDRQLLRAGSIGIGVNMAFRRAVFSQTGTFDTALDVGTPSSGAGDIEMFYRLLVHGHTFVYDPAMLVWHTHRQQLPELEKQIKDNGRSFGCYLLTCYKSKSISSVALLRFFLIDWIGNWHLKNFFKPRKYLPRKYALIELAGVLQSPFAYRASQACARKLATYPKQPGAFETNKVNPIPLE